MTKLEWNKYKRFTPKYNGIPCPYCNEKIYRDNDTDYIYVDYVKTTNGGNLFIHGRCLKRGW